MNKKTAPIILLIAALLVVVVVLAVMANQQSTTPESPAPTPQQQQQQEPPTDEPDTPVEAPAEQNGDDDQLTQSMCEEAGGTWNACGSACRGAGPDTACIEVCVEQCECVDDNQCPDGYACGEFVDDTGICLPE